MWLCCSFEIQLSSFFPICFQFNILRLAHPCWFDLSFWTHRTLTSFHKSTLYKKICFREVLLPLVFLQCCSLHLLVGDKLLASPSCVSFGKDEQTYVCFLISPISLHRRSHSLYPLLHFALFTGNHSVSDCEIVPMVLYGCWYSTRRCAFIQPCSYIWTFR